VNDTLRRALADARLREVDVASALGVDPKTVQRWISGRLPQPRHRWGLADLIGRPEGELWPDADRPDSGTGSREVRAVYPYRGAVPRDAWRSLFDSAEQGIDVLVYSGLFLAEDVGLLRLIAGKARGGVPVRVLLGDPDSPHVATRGVEEGIDDAMAARIRNAIVLYRPLAGVDGVQIRQHGTVLYNSLYRADDELLVNPHIYGTAAAYAPVFHLHRAGDDGMAATYAGSFERVWATATALR
jgi:hypothetical protein